MRAEKTGCENLLRTRRNRNSYSGDRVSQSSLFLLVLRERLLLGCVFVVVRKFDGY